MGSMATPKTGSRENHPAPPFRFAHCTHKTTYAREWIAVVIKTVGAAHTRPHPKSRSKISKILLTYWNTINIITLWNAKSEVMVWVHVQGDRKQSTLKTTILRCELMKILIRLLFVMQNNITSQEQKQFAGQLICFCPKIKNKGNGVFPQKTPPLPISRIPQKGKLHEIL